MKRSVVALAVIIVATVLASCHKPVVNCDYVVRAYIKEFDDSEKEPAEASIAYAFYADQADWEVASYEDALEGVLTHKRSGDKKTYDFTQVMEDGAEAFNFFFDKEPVMLVVAYTELPMHAWRSANVQADLATMNISLLFEPMRVDETYVNLQWNMVNGRTYPIIQLPY